MNEYILIISIIEVIIMPILAWCGYYVRRLTMRLEELEKKTNELETDTKILEVKMDAIKEDITEIKSGVQKLVEKFYRV